jgi:hypothetical protein
MFLLAVIALGPISSWLVGTWTGLWNTYGQLIGGILGIPFLQLFALFFPFNL